MQYDFDRVINRKNTNSSKWDNVGPRTGNPDALPMWVADMDFPSPEPIKQMLRERVEQGIYGYPYRTNGFKKATKRWILKQHGVELKEEWMVFTTGVVPILYTVLEAFSEEGDEVILQQPVYHPFRHAVMDLKRTISNNSLVYVNGRYEIDFENLEKRASSPKAKVMFFCSPHNPGGRCWTKEEVERVCDICYRHHVLLVSDEIHADFLFFGKKHTPSAIGNPQWEQNTILCYAPTKTFNIAGLRGSCAVIPNEQIRSRFEYQIKCNDSVQECLFSLPAYEIAYTQCDEYLEQLLPYLEENIRYLDCFLREHMPKIKLVQPDATFLMWLDCSELGMEAEALYDFFIQKAAVGISRGNSFGEEGGQFVRLNIGCPRAILQQGLAQLKAQYDLLEDR